MKMALAGVHFVLAASGFLLWVGSSSTAPMVCHFDSRGEARSSQCLVWSEYNMYLTKKSVCGSSTLCLWGEELLAGWQLDGRLSAVYLPASRRRRLLRDVSAHTTSMLLQSISLHYRPPRVHRPVDFPAWCQVRVEPVTCRVSLVQTADTRLPCFPGDTIQDPSQGSPWLQQQQLQG